MHSLTDLSVPSKHRTEFPMFRSLCMCQVLPMDLIINSWTRQDNFMHSWHSDKMFAPFSQCMSAHSYCISRSSEFFDLDPKDHSGCIHCPWPAGTQITSEHGHFNPYCLNHLLLDLCLQALHGIRIHTCVLITNCDSTWCALLRPFPVLWFSAFGDGFLSFATRRSQERASALRPRIFSWSEIPANSLQSEGTGIHTQIHIFSCLWIPVFWTEHTGSNSQRICTVWTKRGHMLFLWCWVWTLILQVGRSRRSPGTSASTAEQTTTTDTGPGRWGKVLTTYFLGREAVSRDGLMESCVCCRCHRGRPSTPAPPPFRWHDLII